MLTQVSCNLNLYRVDMERADTKASSNSYANLIPRLISSTCLLLWQLRLQSGHNAGGVMDRVVAQLLAEIDGAQQSAEGSGGLSASHDLFIIGATNR